MVYHLFIETKSLYIIFLAYWIAQKAIKFAIDYDDNFLLDEINETSQDIEDEVNELKNVIFEHFQVSFTFISLSMSSKKTGIYFYRSITLTIFCPSSTATSKKTLSRE